MAIPLPNLSMQSASDAKSSFSPVFGALTMAGDGATVSAQAPATAAGAAAGGLPIEWLIAGGLILLALIARK